MKDKERLKGSLLGSVAVASFFAFIAFLLGASNVLIAGVAFCLFLIVLMFFNDVG